MVDCNGWENHNLTHIHMTLSLQFDQGGLMLPARDYYLNISEKEVVDAYVEYITKVATEDN